MSTASRPPARAQSEVLGSMLLLGIVLTVSISVVLAGSTVLKASESRMDVESAALRFSELDTAISHLDADGGTTRAVSFATLEDGQGDVFVEDTGSTRIVVNDTGTGVEVFNESRTLGQIVYERDDQLIAYQGGGIWRSSVHGNQSTVVSPPDFDYRTGPGGATLSVPLVQVSGNVTDGEFTLEQTTDETLFPDQSVLPNPLTDVYRIDVTIQSDFYRAWHTFLESRTGQNVTVDHETQSVTITLVGNESRNLAGNGGVGGSVLAMGGTQITNAGRIDSYTSATGPWAGPYPERTNAPIYIDDDLDINSAPELGGDLVVTGFVRIVNGPVFYGDVIAGTGSQNTLVSNDAELKSLFSTKGDFEVPDSQTVDFRDDVVVGGSILTFGATAVEGDVHVGETADLANGFSGTLEGNVTAGEDVTIDGAISFDNFMPEQTIVAGDDVTFSGTGGNWKVNVIAGGDVTIPSGSTLTGDIDAGGNVTVDGSVKGNITAGGDIDTTGPGPVPMYTWTANGSPKSPPLSRLRDPVEPTFPATEDAQAIIDQKKATLSWDNSNNAATINAIQTWGGCSAGCSLDAGNYSISGYTLAGSETLTLNTSSGDIEIYVSNDATILGGSIEVIGDGQVTIYQDAKFEIQGSGSSVSTPDENARQLWMYVSPSTSASFKNQDPTFTGVVYGAGSGGTGADIQVVNDATVNGSLVGTFTGFSNTATIHYDEHLEVPVSPTTPPSASSNVTGVSYLHINSRTVDVSS